MAKGNETFAIIYTKEDLRDLAGLISPIETPDFDSGRYESLLDTIASEATVVEENGRTSFDNWFYDKRPDDYDCMVTCIHGAIYDYFKEALKSEGFEL